MIAEGIPELPNFITLLEHYFEEAPWLHFLVYWEDIIFSIIVASVISILFFLGTRKPELIPHGLQNFLEWTYEGIRDWILGILGPEGEKHFPFLATLLIYLVSMNIFGLVPFMKAPSSSLNITLAMALVVFFRVQYMNIANRGFGGYLYHMAGDPKTPVEWMLTPLMLPIELLTQISRPATLALRLFGNMMGEHIIISIFALSSVALFTIGEWKFTIPIQTPFMLFALLTSLMQALVFTLLSAVYILLSTPHEESH